MEKGNILPTMVCMRIDSIISELRPDLMDKFWLSEDCTKILFNFIDDDFDLEVDSLKILTPGVHTEFSKTTYDPAYWDEVEVYKSVEDLWKELEKKHFLSILRGQLNIDKTILTAYDDAQDEIHYQ